MPRDQIRSIAQQAFPTELCQPDGMGDCQFNPDPVFVEPDGSLTKGCGSAPSNTFSIRFAHPNEPLVFEKKALPDSGPRALADVDGDGALDVMASSMLTVHLNDGTNAFNPQATGLPFVGFTLGLGDWNDDGDVDLLASSGSGPRLYPGNGTGTFDDPSSFLIATGPAGPGPIVDLNGDSLPDANVGSRIIWNQTGGPISPATDSIPSIESGMADLDSDSDLDILSGTNFPERVEWAENSGPGSFPVQTAVSFPPGDDLVPMIGQDLVDLLQCENPYPSDCCEDHAGTGCDDMTCQLAVCAEDANCCSFPWDESCVDLARNLCSVCVDPALPNCCSALHGTPGCEAMGCEDIVCHPEREPSCCSGTWNSLCAELADLWCLECSEYAVSCAMPNVEDVSAGDVEGDGDADLVVSVELRQDLEHPNSSPNIEPIYFLWLPNLQVDDPQASGGKPLFDPATAPWQLIGPGQREVEMVDLDGDGDPDALGEGYWYRNDGGTFSGPYGLRGPISDSQFVDILFAADTDDDGDMDVVTVDFLYQRVPEPSVGLMLAVWRGRAAGPGTTTRRTQSLARIPPARIERPRGTRRTTLAGAGVLRTSQRVRGAPPLRCVMTMTQLTAAFERYGRSPTRRVLGHDGMPPVDPESGPNAGGLPKIGS